MPPTQSHSGPILLPLLLLTACSSSPSAPPFDVARSPKLRITTPAVDPTDGERFRADHANLAVDLYHHLRQQPAAGNIAYSPTSIAVALAMTYGGARGTTEAAMSAALHFTLPQDKLHPTFNALDQSLADASPVRLRLVNAVWGQTDYPFAPAYLDLLAEHYGAGIGLLDFRKDPDAARLTINGWVSQQTESRIKDLLPPTALDANTRLVLTNALYLNAAWKTPFTEKTGDQRFQLLDGTTTQVPMMSRKQDIATAVISGHRAAQLPYVGDRLSMIVVLPPAQPSAPLATSFAEFEQTLSADFLAEVVTALESTTTTGALFLPRFTLTASVDLRDTLSALGMSEAFTYGAADFSGIDGTRELFIQDVVHQTFLAVAELGTEAAAATAVVIGTRSAPLDPMFVDRPFIFFIRDRVTGAILFMGRVTNPT